ncbi:MAG: DNA polymerase III subunit delta [Patescibacteria group bacterium]
MLFFLHGNDPFLIQRRKQAFTQAFTKKYPTGEIHSFDFEDTGSGDDVQRALSAAEQGLFATQKCILLLHPLSLREEGAKRLTAFLEKYTETDFPEVTFLFVQSKGFRKNDKLAMLLKKVASKEEVLDTPVGKGLDAWVRQELASIDSRGTITDTALQNLIRATNGELMRLSSELEKLAFFFEDGKVTEESVDELVEFAREEVLFQALDALSRGDKGRALLLFRTQEDGPQSIYPLLSMCAWQVRRLLLLREGYDQGARNASQAASYAGLQPFVAEKALRFISSLPAARLKRALALLSEFDTRLKQGNIDPGVALSLFVWKF